MNLPDAAAAALAGLLPTAPSAAGTTPADQRLREFFRTHPQFGKRDRQQIGDLVFDVLRNLRLYEALAIEGVGQGAATAHVSPGATGDVPGGLTEDFSVNASEGVSEKARLSGKRSGKPSAKPSAKPAKPSGSASGKPPAQAREALERGRRLVAVATAMAAGAPAKSPAKGSIEVPANGPAAAPADAGDREVEAIAARLPDAVRYSMPDWLWEKLQASHGERARGIAAALLQPSPIDIRANLLLGKAEDLARRLREQGVEAEAIAGVPTGLRVIGRPNLEKLDLFERGWFEIQDAGSQRIVDFCEPRRGQLVVDFCAGAGGKTLAMAARMRNAGKVLAFDTGDERLSRLMPRARRAGVGLVEPLRIDGGGDARLARYRGRADLVLVDAPCSGTGTLRRSPDMKWRLSPKRLLQHVAEQRAILAAASALVKPGGKLVYATCSLLQEENERQVAEFARPGFELIDSRSFLPDEGPSSGFFVAKWELASRP